MEPQKRHSCCKRVFLEAERERKKYSGFSLPPRLSCNLLTIFAIGRIRPKANCHGHLGNLAMMIQSKAGKGQGVDPRAHRLRTIIHSNQKASKLFFLRFGNKSEGWGACHLCQIGAKPAKDYQRNVFRSLHCLLLIKGPRYSNIICSLYL